MGVGVSVRGDDDGTAIFSPMASPVRKPRCCDCAKINASPTSRTRSETLPNTEVLKTERLASRGQRKMTRES